MAKRVPLQVGMVGGDLSEYQFFPTGTKSQVPEERQAGYEEVLAAAHVHRLGDSRYLSTGRTGPVIHICLVRSGPLADHGIKARRGYSDRNSWKVRVVRPGTLREVEL